MRQKLYKSSELSIDWPKVLHSPPQNWIFILIFPNQELNLLYQFWIHTELVASQQFVEYEYADHKNLNFKCVNSLFINFMLKKSRVFKRRNKGVILKDQSIRPFESILNFESLRNRTWFFSIRSFESKTFFLIFCRFIKSLFCTGWKHWTIGVGSQYCLPSSCAPWCQSVRSYSSS